MQQILKYNDKEINVVIAQFICSNITFYCTQKISSNVVESTVRLKDSPQSQNLFFQHLASNTKAFHDIMFDQYGNYVIQAVFQ